MKKIGLLAVTVLSLSSLSACGGAGANLNVTCTEFTAQSLGNQLATAKAHLEHKEGVKHPGDDLVEQAMQALNYNCGSRPHTKVGDVPIQ